MPADPTDADRKRVMAVLADVQPGPRVWERRVDALAAALAGERERARAPFLALAAAAALEAHDEEASRAVAMWDMADRIRTAAQESTP